MGKRKERRLAAMAAAGRRVKLDLFAEPSGEMEGTSIHDEVGGDQNQDHRAGPPSSPSSSEQKQENPLLLLGQYSDDELDDEAPERPKHAGDERSTDPNDQVEEHVGAREDISSITDNDDNVGDVKQVADGSDTIKSFDDSNVREGNITSTVDQYSVTNAETQICVPEASETQTFGDVTGVWKVVMDEQSNQYYYWNTVTGETSWEVPSGLVLETERRGEQNISSTDEERVDSHVDMNASVHSNTVLMAYADISTVDQLGSGLMISKSLEEYGTAEGVEKGNRHGAHLVYDTNQLVTNYSTIGISYGDSAVVPDFVSSQQPNTLLSEQFTTSGEVHHLSSDEHKDQHMTKPGKCQEHTDVHSDQLVKYGESLLQRLETLARSGDYIAGRECIKMEIELRLSDCKALSSYGSSLLPFWWHTETQLKQLESAIGKAETFHLVQLQHGSELELGTNSALGGEHPLPQDVGERSELVEKEKDSFFTAENNGSMTSDASKAVDIGANSSIPDGEDKTGSMGIRQEPEVLLEGNENPLSSHIVSSNEPHVEEVDMDVEMEVDEETPVLPTAGAPLEPIIQASPTSSECPVAPKDDFSIPPPPDEEWIPPPPPESELVPPPPPEEPPEPSLPQVETMPAHPYQEQYNMGYTVPVYNYYTPTVGDIATNNYYAHVEGSHVAETQQPTYYEAVNASAFPEVGASVNPVDTTGYYGVPSVSIAAAPIVSSVESSGYYVEAGAVSYSSIAPLPDQTKSTGMVMESGSITLPHVKLESDVSSIASESKTDAMKETPGATNVQATETVLMNGSSAVGASVSVPKNQPKVRTKKRSVAVATSLRSNKKVSSLVDKWKAAKEELHAEEDKEPENAYEVLERKRQREIEEWRERQIASGEAQDNANFLPLGGDWRERVRRKRAQAKAEEAQSPLEAVEDEKRQPDLIELSKDLPSGWQAYWDESSKEVYYGNTVTSETTWARPTQ